MIKSLQEIMPLVIDLKTFSFKIDTDDAVVRHGDGQVGRVRTTQVTTQTSPLQQDRLEELSLKIRELHDTCEAQKLKIAQLESGLSSKNKFKDTLSKSLYKSMLTPESRRYFSQLKQAVHCEEENFMKCSIEGFFEDYFRRSTKSSSDLREIDSLRKMISLHESKQIETTSKFKELMNLCKGIISTECDQPVAMYMKKIEIKKTLKDLETFDPRIPLPNTLFSSATKSTDSQSKHKLMPTDQKQSSCVKCGTDDPNMLCLVEETKLVNLNDGKEPQLVKCRRFEINHLFV